MINKRLVCFTDKGFCRYYMGLRETTKHCEWRYFSSKTLSLLEEIAPRKISKHLPRRYAEKHGLLLPKYVRKTAWRLMIKTMNMEVARFIQSRFGELRVSEARYEDLISLADQAYPIFLKHLTEIALINYQWYEVNPTHTTYILRNSIYSPYINNSNNFL
ncbi:hypothetical protein Smar_0569 [Staphylothermus marinus F1]|uniref:Integrase SSV1 C-terminal domain-containing protein n=1 Tax=Staphylothermus marinus (strain ATCC 43588 / DSM 3639 / JCM 9404 / F1) TaxID=399550 RepID=A3DM16_STAMF|nr:integrase [Staphylothermus marinus]ABN69676.1 hypothetical protein Smar_0569 [Staphylothermus marinus F1]